MITHMYHLFFEISLKSFVSLIITITLNTFPVHLFFHMLAAPTIYRCFLANVNSSTRSLYMSSAGRLSSVIL